MMTTNRKRYNRRPEVGDRFVYAQNFNTTPRIVTAVGERTYLYKFENTAGRSTNEYIGHIAEFTVNAVEPAVEVTRPTVKDCWGYLRYGRFWRMPDELDARAIVNRGNNPATHTLARIIDGQLCDEHGVRFHGEAAA